jgi:hypothetical protein
MFATDLAPAHTACNGQKSHRHPPTSRSNGWRQERCHHGLAQPLRKTLELVLRRYGSDCLLLNRLPLSAAVAVE